jgi:hypothetical protein
MQSVVDLGQVRSTRVTDLVVYCVYPAMSKKSENLSDLNKKDRNKRHSSPFINVVKGVFFVVRVTLVPVVSCIYLYKFTNLSLPQAQVLFTTALHDGQGPGWHNLKYR